MHKYRVSGGVQTCVDVFLGDVVFVELFVGERGHVMIVGIIYGAFQPEVVLV